LVIPSHSSALKTTLQYYLAVPEDPSQAIDLIVQLFE
jgi:hypothetical protein